MPSLQVALSRAFAGAMNKPDGSQVPWKFLAPLLVMLDQGGPCQIPGELEPIRLDNVRSALLAACKDMQNPIPLIYTEDYLE